MKILIVEDEPKVASFIKKGLEVNNFETSIAHDGQLALRKLSDHIFDLVILDINLPKINGLNVLSQIRDKGLKTPVLLLTALGTTRDKVTGFELGADDYLVKPFEFEELLARIKALIKRASSESRLEKILRVADLEMHVESKRVVRAGHEIELTAKEFMLLEFLMRNKGKVLSRGDIAQKIWDISFDTGTNVIDLYIFYLRKKIDKNFNPKLIHTQIGMGYVLKEK
jgi:DNA-binding response OmpR family regulator